jgi:hypothetical protein
VFVDPTWPDGVAVVAAHLLGERHLSQPFVALRDPSSRTAVREAIEGLGAGLHAQDTSSIAATIEAAARPVQTTLLLLALTCGALAAAAGHELRAAPGNRPRDAFAAVAAANLATLAARPLAQRLVDRAAPLPIALRPTAGALLAGALPVAVGYIR